MGEHDSAVPIVNLALKLAEGKREFTRIPLHAAGILVIDDRTIDCEVENISMKGAYVTLDPLLEINTCVVLTIFGTPTSGMLSDVKARVVSVMGNGVGLQFE